MALSHYNFNVIINCLLYNYFISYKPLVFMITLLHLYGHGYVTTVKLITPTSPFPVILNKQLVKALCYVAMQLACEI